MASPSAQYAFLRGRNMVGDAPAGGAVVERPLRVSSGERLSGGQRAIEETLAELDEHQVDDHHAAKKREERGREGAETENVAGK